MGASFSERLKKLRHEENISQQALAKILGISKSSVNMYERGEREPSLETQEAIADYFNVDIDYLLGKTDYKRRAREFYDYLTESMKSGAPDAEDQMRKAFGDDKSTLSAYLCEDNPSKIALIYYKTFPRKSASAMSDILMMLEVQEPDVIENIMYIVNAYLCADPDAKAIVDLALKPYIEQEKEAREKLETGI